MAMRVPTNQEKEDLKAFNNFREECKWGILNKAAYWKGQDGVSPPGGDRIKWAKCRTYAGAVVSNPAQVNPDSNTTVVDRFLVYVKNIACVDGAVAFDAGTTTTWLVNNSQFDSMADTWFDDQVATMIF